MSARLRHGLTRGFTLVELMVALSGGLFLSMVVFALARDSNRFYQQQTRLANATMSGIVGFDRLRADISRAGFLSTPNILGPDPDVCTRPTGGSPARLQTLRSVWLTKPSSAASPTLTANGITPMQMHLAGSFTSTDEFPGMVSPDGATVTLQPNTGPMARLGYSLTADMAEQEAVLRSIFMVGTTGRMMRIVDRSGKQHYAVVAGVAGGPDPQLTIDTVEPLIFRSGGTSTCGLRGLEVGATINVVNIMRYDVRSLSSVAGYAALFDDSAGTVGPFDADRTELVRVELDPKTGNEIPGTLELLSEYAVDLQVSFTVWDPVGGTLETYGPDDSVFDTYFPTNPATNTQVQHIRALRARLAVRSREADRGSDVDTSLNGLYRIGLGTSGGAPFARVRNFQADIALHNHGRSEW